MAWNDWIARHGKLVLVIWLLIIVVSIPLAVKLNSITQYGMDQMLPKHIESVKVQEIVTKNFTGAGSENTTYLILTNVKVNDVRSREAYEAFKERVDGRYAHNVTSYYDVMDMLRNMSHEVALNVTRMTANVSGMLYSIAVKTNESYGKALSQTYALANTTEAMKERLLATAQGYLALRRNLTTLYTRMNNLSLALNETDHAYVMLHQNLTETSTLLRNINASITGTNAALYSLNESYGRTFIGVIAVHKALLDIGAYDRGTLSQEEASTIASQTGTTEEFVFAVFNTLYPIYSQGGSGSITDGVLAETTEKLILNGTGESQRWMAGLYGEEFISRVQAFDAEKGSNFVLQGLQPAELEGVVSGMATAALRSLPEAIAESNTTLKVPGMGEVDPETMSLLVNASISLGKNPKADAVESTTVNFAMAFLREKNPNSPVIRSPRAAEVLTTLLREGPTRELESSLLIEALEKEVPQELEKAVPLMVSTILNGDPLAEGLISNNPGALENATVDVISKLSPPSTPKSLLKAVYESHGGSRELDGIAKDTLREGLIGKLAGKVVNPEAVAGLVVDEATSNPDGIISGENLENATVSVVLALIPGSVKGPQTAETVRALYSGESPKTLAEETFLNATMEKISGTLPPGTPEEVKEAVVRIVKEVVRGYPLDEGRLDAIVKAEVGRIIQPYVKRGVGGVKFNVNTTRLVDLAFTFRDNPNALTVSDVRPIAEQIYPSIYRTARSYIEAFKSNDNTTMLITFVPIGKTAPGQDQYKYLAGNATIVKGIAIEEFKKYYPNVTGALGGNPMELHEMFALGQKDNERTTRASVLGALIILFILMGAALLATLLPFTGVATASLTALGLTYLAAKGGITDVGSWARMITITTSLGLGIDYSTYYLHRFKEYLAEGYTHEKAVSEALKRSKDAVLASAFTDIIAFASFTLAYEFPMFQQMGIIAPLAVVTVLIASLTFIPAITALVGDKAAFWWPRHLRFISPDVHERSRIAKWVTKHAKVVLLVGLLIAVPATYTFFHFNGSHDMTLFLPENSETYHFLQLSQEKFGAAVSSPYYIVLEFNGPISDSDLKTIQKISLGVSKFSGVTAVYSPTMPYGEPVSNLSLRNIEPLGGSRYISKDGRTVLIQVSGRYSPDSNEAKALVKDLRDYVKGFTEKGGEIRKAMVGGSAALSMDLSDKINNIFWHRILPVALLLMFLSLIPTLRGMPAVLSTMATIFLGVMTSIWVSTWLFEKIFGQEVMWFLPLMVFVVLMGVGIDYNSFYLVKARDEFERRSAVESLIVAAGTMDTLVIGLAAVLATTYGSLMLSGTWGTREMGFALAFGVLLTAIMAVYFIGPAMMSLFGDKAWWPLFRRRKD